MDLLILKGVDLGWLFWIIMPSLMVLHVVAIIYIWRPSELGYRAAQGAVLLGLLENFVVSMIGFMKPEILKQAFIASRTERGLPVRQEVLRMMESPAGRLFPIILTVILAGVCLYLLAKINRENEARA